MIITKIIGGLGNQMFQYATARALSLRLGQPLRLDISGFDGYGLHHGFELERVFFCPIELATGADVRAILGWQSSPRIRRILRHPWLKELRRRQYIVEPQFEYWPNVRRVTGDCYLDGYWQSEKYFDDVAETIRRGFTFKQPFDNRNAEVAMEIGGVNSISLHVRRGDYAIDPKTNATHGLCSLDYYRSAIRHVAERVNEPHFFIFSDDMAWVRDNMKMEFPSVHVCHNTGAENYRDMQLMSLCQHNIIANSSFSWWGAWLNPNRSKIVVAPGRWFAGSGRATNDLIPTGWVRL